MKLKEIIEQILSSRPNLTYEEVYTMIQNKKKSAEEFFTDETAARLIASELGVEINREPLQLEILIQDLVSGLNDVTVTGRVIMVHHPKTYTRPDRSEGKSARLTIADKSGTLRVVLWDDKADLVEDGKVEQGQIIRISHGYMREGLDGKLELHVGSRGSLQISPPNVVESRYPPVTEFIKKVKVAAIKEEGGPVIVEGTVTTPPVIKEVVTSRNEKIKVASFELSDDTGKIWVSAWRKLAEIMKDFTVGTRIKIKNAYVRRGFADQLELTSRTLTSIEVLSKPEKPPT
jgi:replication factor A1